MLQWIGYDHKGQEWKTEKTWIIQELSKKGWKRMLLKMILAETTYVFWRARNDVIFNKKPIDPDLFTQIQ